MTYLWFPAPTIDMTLEEGRPVALVWRGRLHRVLWVAEEWRMDAEW
jgi:hypothetical protein